MDLNYCKVIPVLKVCSVNLAKQFYVDCMGFKVEWEKYVHDKSYNYLIVSFNHIIFHLTDYDKEEMSTGKFFIEYSDLSGYCEFLRTRRCGYKMIDLEMVPGKSVGIEIEDPFGHHLIFFEPEEI